MGFNFEELRHKMDKMGHITLKSANSSQIKPKITNKNISLMYFWLCLLTGMS